MWGGDSRWLQNGQQLARPQSIGVRATRPRCEASRCRGRVAHPPFLGINSHPTKKKRPRCEASRCRGRIAHPPFLGIDSHSTKKKRPRCEASRYRGRVAHPPVLGINSHPTKKSALVVRRVDAVGGSPTLLFWESIHTRPKKSALRRGRF